MSLCILRSRSPWKSKAPEADVLLSREPREHIHAGDVSPGGAGGVKMLLVHRQLQKDSDSKRQKRKARGCPRKDEIVNLGQRTSS